MKWISVEERLPEKLEKVLFYWGLLDLNGLIFSRNISMGYLCDEGWNIYLPYDSFGFRNDTCSITHWMELPDYPKPDSLDKLQHGI